MKWFRRFILPFLFIGILPPVMVLLAFQTWAGFVDQERQKAFFQESSRHLRELKDRINFQSDREQVAGEIVARFARDGVLNAERLRDVRNEMEKRYPGMLEIFAFRIKPHLPWDYQTMEVSILDQSVRFRSVFEMLARYLAQQKDYLFLERLLDPELFNSLPEPALDGGRAKMIQKILGNGVTPVFVANRRMNPVDTSRNSRPCTFYWNTVDLPRPADPDETDIHGLVIVYIFRDRFQEYFSEEKLVSRKREEIGNSSILLSRIQLTDEVSIHRQAQQWPELQQLEGRTPGAETALSGKNHLLTLMPVRDTDGLMLAARTERTACFPERQSRFRLLIIVSGIWLILMGLLLVALQSGRLQLFMPVKLQIAALFLLAACLPLGAIFHLGLQTLSAERVRNREALFAELERRISQLDADALSYRGMLQHMASSVMREPVMRQLNIPAIWKLLYPHWQEDRIDKYMLFDPHGKLLLSERYKEVAGPSGEVILVNKDKDEGLETRIMSVMSRVIIQFVNTGRLELQRGKDGQQDILADTVMEKLKGESLSREGLNFGLLQGKGRITRIQLLSVDFNLFSEPVLDSSGHAVAALTMIFRMRDHYQEIMTRFFGNHCKVLPGGIIMLPWLITEQGSFNTFYREEYTAELRNLRDKAIAENAPQRREILHRGKPMLAVSRKLREMNDYAVVACAPMDHLVSADWRNIRLLILIMTMVILIAVIVAVTLARRIVQPVKDLENGVRAVMRGDYNHRLIVKSSDEFGLLADNFNKMSTGLAEKERMSRYVSEVVREAVKSEAIDRLGEEKVCTVLFSDIRNFTTLSETHPPREIVAMLNEYLEAMSRVIQSHGGVIDKFIGDAVMAVFHGDFPAGAGPDAPRAVAAAMDMCRELENFNAQRQVQGLFTIANGTGIHTGTVILGDIGAKDVRVDLTVIGDTVNLAARLEAVSKEGRHTHIVISEATMRKLDDRYILERMGERTVKGKNQAVAIYEVVSELETDHSADL